MSEQDNSHLLNLDSSAQLVDQGNSRNYYNSDDGADLSVDPRVKPYLANLALMDQILALKTNRAHKLKNLALKDSNRLYMHHSEYKKHQEILKAKKDELDQRHTPQNI